MFHNKYCTHIWWSIRHKWLIKKRLKQSLNKRLWDVRHPLRPAGRSVAKLLVRLPATSCRSVAGGRTLQGSLRWAKAMRKTAERCSEQCSTPDKESQEFNVQKNQKCTKITIKNKGLNTWQLSRLYWYSAASIGTEPPLLVPSRLYWYSTASIGTEVPG